VSISSKHLEKPLDVALEVAAAIGMKKVMTTAAAITLLGSGAIAGSVDAPAPDAIVTPIATPVASVTDFSGFYAGLTLGSISEGRGTYHL
jgi:hypothetical protein